MTSKQRPKNNQRQNHPDKLRAIQRQQRVLELATAGWTYQMIADEVGYANKSGVLKALRAALKRTVAGPAQNYRDVQLNQILELMREIRPYTLARTVKKKTKVGNKTVTEDVLLPPNPEYIDRVDRLMKRMAALLGLDKQVHKTQLSNDPKNPVNPPQDRTQVQKDFAAWFSTLPEQFQESYLNAPDTGKPPADQG